MGLAAPAPRPARANGAFPESYQLVLPADRPRQIVLATNFGLIISDDGAATWTWTCERDATAMGSALRRGGAAAARPLLLDVDARGPRLLGRPLVHLGHVGRQPSTTVLANDYFPDPTNPMRVYALGAKPASDDDGPAAGHRVGRRRHDLRRRRSSRRPRGSRSRACERARSARRTLYVSTYSIKGFHPTLQRSTDGGAHWTPIDVEPSIGANSFRIIAVDPGDARILTVRVIGTTGESLAISRDGGMTFTKVVDVAGQLTGYVRLDSGTILVSGALATEGVGFRSTDGGLTFAPWTPVTTDGAGVPDVSSDGGVQRPPHLRALAARGGKLYAAAKNFSDDWAVGVSTDEGPHHSSGSTRYRPTSNRSVACAQAVCLAAARRRRPLRIWPLGGLRGATVTPAAAREAGCGCGIGPPSAAAGAGRPPAGPRARLAALCDVARADGDASTDRGPR